MKFWLLSVVTKKYSFLTIIQILCLLYIITKITFFGWGLRVSPNQDSPLLIENPFSFGTQCREIPIQAPRSLEKSGGGLKKVGG